MSLPLFSIFVHVYTLLSVLHQLLPLHRLPILSTHYAMFVPGPAPSRGLNSTIHHCVRSRVRCRITRLLLMCRTSRKCVEVVVFCPSVIVTSFCPIPTWKRGSSVGCPVVDVACLRCVVSAPELIVPLLPALKTSNLRRICRRLCNVLMRSRHTTLYAACHLTLSF